MPRDGPLLRFALRRFCFTWNNIEAPRRVVSSLLQRHAGAEPFRCVESLLRHHIEALLPHFAEALPHRIASSLLSCPTRTRFDEAEQPRSDEAAKTPHMPMGPQNSDGDPFRHS